MALTLDEVWGRFGERRFTTSDLWSAFGYGESPGFPTPEWLAKLGIEHASWAEPAPGPRGGKGWRLTAEAIVAAQAAKAKRTAKADRLKALLAEVVPPIGECRISWAGRFEWSYRPEMDIPGNQPDGRRRHSRDEFCLSWPSTAKAKVIRGDLDRATAHIVSLAALERARRQAEIETLDRLIADLDAKKSKDG